MDVDGWWWGCLRKLKRENERRQKREKEREGEKRQREKKIFNHKHTLWRASPMCTAAV